MPHIYVFHNTGKKGPFSISTHDFECFLSTLVQKGLQPCNTRELTFTQSEDKFLITFDDAFKTVLEFAFPIMEKYGIKGVVFAPTAFIGTHDNFLTWEELRYLHVNGWAIGSHTVNHCRLSLKLYDEDQKKYEERIKYEIGQSKKVLEDKLETEISLFAYPYGEVNSTIRSIVAMCGYKEAFVVGLSPYDTSKDAFEISRQDITMQNNNPSEPEGISVIIPAHNRPEILAESLRRLKLQSYPPEKFEVIVVDDSSDDNIEPIVRGNGIQFIYYRLEDKNTKFNAGHARQTGAMQASHPILQFLDADILVDEHFLWAVQWVHYNCPETICLGYISGYNLEDQGHKHLLQDLKGVEGGINIIPDRSREPALRSCIDNIQLLDSPWRLCYTGNFSIGKANFFRTGGFEQKFTGWGLEDIEFGFRSFQHKLNWVFSRFAVGYHIIDESETISRNPFKIGNPQQYHFNGYLTNLELLKALHPVPEIEKFYEQSLEDIQNILNCDQTVGVEFGGFCKQSCSFHNKINKCSSGEVSFEELKDRVLFAVKSNARSLYLLGGEPSEHKSFKEFLLYAKSMGFHITAETNGINFSNQNQSDCFFASGLDKVVLKIMSFNAKTFIKISNSSLDKFYAFIKGYEYLKKNNRITSIRLVVNEVNIDEFDVIMNEIAWIGLEQIIILKQTKTL